MEDERCPCLRLPRRRLLCLCISGRPRRSLGCPPSTLFTLFPSYLRSLDPSQRIPSFLRFFRDSAIVDIGFTITFTIVATICARRSATRALLCEQLSRQPELLRNLANSGLNFENCEQWFEDVVLVFVLVMAVSILMRVRTPVLAYALCSPFLIHVFPDPIHIYPLQPLLTPCSQATTRSHGYRTRLPPTSRAPPPTLGADRRWSPGVCTRVPYGR